ncbi:MAG: hypothetical protein GY757_18820 [bacterium]|nr:hypothetical protein [bacterium]
MKLISEELQNSADSCIKTPDTAESGYPLSNVFNDEPEEWYQSDTVNKVTTLYIKVDASSAGASAFQLNYTNATSISIELFQCDTADETTPPTNSVVGAEVFSLISPHRKDRLYYSYDEARTAITWVEVILTPPSDEAVYVGIIRAGVVTTYDNPEYGAKLGKKDNSIIQRMADGRPRVIVGTKKRFYNLSMDMDPTDKLVFEDLLDNFDGQGFASVPISGIDDSEYCMYCMIVDESKNSTNWRYYNNNNKQLYFEEL